MAGVGFVEFKNRPAIQRGESVQVECETQEEVDYYWEKLGAGGDPEAQQCGWLKDKYGLSGQIVPKGMAAMMNSADSARASWVMKALLQMKKLDIAALERAARG